MPCGYILGGEEYDRPEETLDDNALLLTLQRRTSFFLFLKMIIQTKVAPEIAP